MTKKKGAYAALKAQYYLDDAILEAGPDAELLWVRILSFLASVRSDGVITDRQIKMVGYGLRNLAKRARTLQEVGLLIPVGDSLSAGSEQDGSSKQTQARSYEARSWLKWNRSTQEIDKYLASERERKAQKRAGEAELSARKGDDVQADSALSTVQTSTETVIEAAKAASTRRAARGSRIEPDWMPSPELIAQMRAECPGVDLDAEHRVFIDYWIAQPGQRGVKLDWEATWRNWMRRKHGDGGGVVRAGGPQPSLRQSPVARARDVVAELRALEES